MSILSLNKNRGFTLIELLVVVAIIALLAAILFPLFARSIESGRRTACRSNLREIGAAMMVFASDHNGWFPLSTGDYENPLNSNNELEGQWPLTGVVREMYTNDVLKNLSVWVCPSDRVEGRRNNQKVSVTNSIAGFNSYGNASYMYVAGLNTKLNLQASRAVVLLDESNSLENGSRTPGNMPDIAEYDNHGEDFRNVLYFDGRVVSIEGSGVANQIIFPEDETAWIDDYAKIQSID